MKLVSYTFVSVDGVMQHNDPGFDRGAWFLPHASKQGQERTAATFARADAFLLGRRTYEAWAGFWGPMEGHPVADALNSKPKYLASTTVADPAWQNTTVLSGDVPAAIRELKERRDGELQLHGSGVLLRSLLEHDLIDEMVLMVAPVVVGAGTRLFPQDGPDFGLELTDTYVTPTGVVMLSYRNAGAARYSTSLPAE